MRLGSCVRLDPPVAKRAVLVVGSSSGIGQAAALALAESGRYRVFCGLRGAAPPLVAAAAQACPDAVSTLTLDVVSAESCALAAAKLGEELGDEGLYAVVNAAGVSRSGPLAPAEAGALEALAEAFDVNALGFVRVAQAFVPLLSKSNGGRIVAVSSVSGHVALPFFGPYAASKHALEALCDSLRVELALAKTSISVSLVVPGPVSATALWNKGASRRGRLLELARPGGPLEAYGTSICNAIDAAVDADRSARSLDATDRAVFRALEDRHPRARYYVLGTPTRVQLLASRWLPTRLFDSLVVRRLGKARKHEPPADDA